MKITINEPKLVSIASDLKVSPNKLVKSLIKHAGQMSIHARNDVTSGRRTLDEVMTDLFANALPGLILNDLIREIVGEHEYVIDDGGFSREEGIIWVLVEFLKGTVLNMGSITLQFGKDPGIVATEYIENIQVDEDLDEMASEIEDEINEKDPVFDLDRFDSISLYDDGDGAVTIELQINWKDMLDLPRVAEIDEIMREIKERVYARAKKKRGKKSKFS